MFTLILVESHTALRQSLWRWLATNLASCAIVATDNMTQAAELAQARLPCAILLDLDVLPQSNPGEIQRLKRLCPAPAIIGIGLDDTPAHRQRATQIGITLFMSKSQLPADLIPALQVLLEGATP